jgi:hypothetical protein
MWIEWGENKFTDNVAGGTSFRKRQFEKTNKKITLSWILGRQSFEDQRWIEVSHNCDLWRTLTAAFKLRVLLPQS